MKESYKPILIAFLFAVVLIASSHFLKGRSVGDWVDAAIYMAAVYFIFRYYAVASKACPVKLHNS